LDKVGGVERSFANYTGTLIRLSLRSGADPEKVAEEARRILGEETHEGSAIRLPTDESGHALQTEEWRDVTRIGELSSKEFRTLVFRASLAVAAVLGVIAIWVARRRWRAMNQRT
jgi:hypothetical protein